MTLGAEVGFVFVYIAVLVGCFFVVRKRLRDCQEKQWCAECKNYVLASTSQTNKRANILLSVLTLGIWLLVWACTADLSAKGAPVCPACGKITGETAGAEPSAAEPTEL